MACRFLSITSWLLQYYNADTDFVYFSDGPFMLYFAFVALVCCDII